MDFRRMCCHYRFLKHEGRYSRWCGNNALGCQDYVHQVFDAACMIVLYFTELFLFIILGIDNL